MASYVVLQSRYGCETCRAAGDIYGRSCGHGDLFPVLLLMAGKGSCPNYEFDRGKAEEQIKAKENKVGQ